MPLHTRLISPIDDLYSPLYSIWSEMGSSEYEPDNLSESEDENLEKLDLITN